MVELSFVTQLIEGSNLLNYKEKDGKVNSQDMNVTFGRFVIILFVFIIVCSLVSLKIMITAQFLRRADSAYRRFCFVLV